MKGFSRERRRAAITGSFNFTRAAQEKNAENLLVIHDPALAARYAENWKVHADHSEAYAAKEVAVDTGWLPA